MCTPASAKIRNMLNECNSNHNVLAQQSDKTTMGVLCHVLRHSNGIPIAFCKHGEVSVSYVQCLIEGQCRK